MIYGLLIAAIIILIVTAILDYRIKRRKKYAMQALEPTQNTSHSSVITQTVSTGISLQTLPQTKENVAYGTLPTHTIVSPQFQLEENVAYGTHTNQQQQSAAHPVQQQSMAYINEEYKNVKVQHPQPRQQQ